MLRNSTGVSIDDCAFYNCYSGILGRNYNIDVGASYKNILFDNCSGVLIFAEPQISFYENITIKNHQVEVTQNGSQVWEPMISINGSSGIQHTFSNLLIHDNNFIRYGNESNPYGTIINVSGYYCGMGRYRGIIMMSLMVS